MKKPEPLEIDGKTIAACIEEGYVTGKKTRGVLITDNLIYEALQLVVFGAWLMAAHEWVKAGDTAPNTEVAPRRGRVLKEFR